MKVSQQFWVKNVQFLPKLIKDFLPFFESPQDVSTVHLQLIPYQNLHQLDVERLLLNWVEVETFKAWAIVKGIKVTIFSQILFGRSNLLAAELFLSPSQV